MCGQFPQLAAFAALLTIANAYGPAEIIPFEGGSVAMIDKLNNMNPIIETYELSIKSNLTDIALCGLSILKKIEQIKNHSEICKSKHSMAELILIERSIEQGAYNLRAVRATSKRPKRFLESTLDWLANSFGLLTVNDLAQITQTSDNLRTQQKEIIEQVVSEKKAMLTTFENLKAVAYTVNNISAIAQDRLNMVKDYVNEADQDSETLGILNDAAKHFFDASAGCIDLLISKRVTGKLLNLTRLDAIYEGIRKNLTPDTKIAVDSLLELSIQRKATTKVINNILIVQLKVPIVSIETWEVFNIKKGVMVKDNKLITLDLEEQLLAINPNNYTAKIHSLKECYITHQDTLACYINSTIKNDKSCVSTVVKTNSVNSSLCENHIFSAKIQSDFVIRMDEAQVLVVPHTLTNISITCIPAWRFTVMIRQPSIIRSNQPCTLLINDLMFMEAPTKFKEVDVTVTFDVKIDFNHHIVSDDAPTLPKLSQTRLDSLEELGQKIKELNEREINTVFLDKIFRKETYTPMIISIGFGLLALALISLYIYCKCNCCCCCW